MPRPTSRMLRLLSLIGLVLLASTVINSQTTNPTDTTNHLRFHPAYLLGHMHSAISKT